MSELFHIHVPGDGIDPPVKVTIVDDGAPIPYPLRAISLGGGVQSTVMALMGAEGAFGPPPDVAIFADTGWEPKAVYEHLDWLETQLPFPVYRVQHRNLKEDTERGVDQDGKPGVAIPVFTRQVGERGGMMQRRCTSHYKVYPIHRKLRELLGVSPRGGVHKGDVEQWMGISTDEAIRIKPSRMQWIVQRWPLIEGQLSRNDCLAWFSERYPGRALVKSACVGCPYHSDAQWVATKRLDPAGFDEAVRIDAALRDREEPTHILNTVFLHRRRLPLADAVALSEAQGTLDMQDGFGDECDGVCGV